MHRITFHSERLSKIPSAVMVLGIFLFFLRLPTIVGRICDNIRIEYVRLCRLIMWRWLVYVARIISKQKGKDVDILLESWNNYRVCPIHIYRRLKIINSSHHWKRRIGWQKR